MTLDLFLEERQVEGAERPSCPLNCEFISDVLAPTTPSSARWRFLTLE
ncbi:hypothetical protein ACFRH6_11415 [Streptomyces sp. NPDC056749]